MSNTRARKPGGGRKPSKPEYSAAKNLAQQMKAAADLYTDKMSLQAIADTLSLNPIKVRKLLITAGVYESAIAETVQHTFHKYRETQSYKDAILSTASELKLSIASVTSYLPYKKGVYFPSTAEKEKISVGAERQRRYRAMKRWRTDPIEENFWGVVVWNFIGGGLPSGEDAVNTCLIPRGVAFYSGTVEQTKIKARHKHSSILNIRRNGESNMVTVAVN